MTCRQHSELDGMHAFLSPSKCNFLNWDLETLKERLISSYATSIGTAVHELAATLINRRMRLTENDKNLVIFDLVNHKIPRAVFDIDFIFPTLMMYVNDAIDFGLDTEQHVKHSEYAFGTCDGILYSPEKKFLRIHDLKTGVTPAHMEQLMIYAAYFCSEFNIKPESITIELRIYQSGQITYYRPDGKEIRDIIDIVSRNNKYITEILAL